MKDHHELYLKRAVFEKLRNISLKNYGLSRRDYFGVYLGVPGLSWHAILKMTKTELELDMIQILTCIYSLKKVQEVEFLIYLRCVLQDDLEYSKELRELRNNQLQIKYISKEKCCLSIS